MLMKVLSLRQPWADLIVDGRKKVETRKWNTSYRGWFWVHASKSVDWNACKKLGVTPSATMAVIGKAFLESVKKYETEKEWNADKGRHLALVLGECQRSQCTVSSSPGLKEFLLFLPKEC